MGTGMNFVVLLEMEDRLAGFTVLDCVAREGICGPDAWYVQTLIAMLYRTSPTWWT